MVKTTTKFVNTTATDFDLKEGNAGVYTDVCTLAAAPGPENQHSIELDVNATYREYIVATGDNDGNRVLVTSDDCAEFSTIKIVQDGDKYTFEGEKHPSKASGIWGWIWGWKFSNRKPQPA